MPENDNSEISSIASASEWSEPESPHIPDIDLHFNPQEAAHRSPAYRNATNVQQSEQVIMIGEPPGDNNSPFSQGMRIRPNFLNNNSRPKFIDKSIASDGAGPCIIFAITGKRADGTPVAVLTHLHNSVEISTWTTSGNAFKEGFLNLLREGNNSQTDTIVDHDVNVYMVGGYTAQSELLIRQCDGLIDELNKSVPVKTIHKKVKQDWISSLMIHMDEEGNFQTYTYQAKKNPNHRPLNDMRGLATSVASPVTSLVSTIPKVIHGR